MKIAFTGPGGSGKTTLAKMLSKRIKLPLITEQFRDAAKAIGYDPRADPVGKDKWLACEMLGFVNQMYMEEGWKVTTVHGFISDRTVFDYMFYTEVFGKCQPKIELACEMMYASIEHSASIARSGCDTLYDLIFHVPPFTKTVEDDGFRYRRKKDKEKENDVVKGILKSAAHYGLKVVRLEEITIEERFQEIMTEVETHPAYRHIAERVS